VAAKTRRQNWLDEATQTPLIEEYTQKLSSFVEVMADGQIDNREIAEQEQRLIAMMKQVEPTLDDQTHEQVTRLLCELTAYNVMQTLSALQAARPKTTFHG
jgi:hypothetical protein